MSCFVRFYASARQAAHAFAIRVADAYQDVQRKPIESWIASRLLRLLLVCPGYLALGIWAIIDAERAYNGAVEDSFGDSSVRYNRFHEVVEVLEVCLRCIIVVLAVTVTDWRTSRNILTIGWGLFLFKSHNPLHSVHLSSCKSV